MDYCFLYPGQGAQYPGMGKDLWENSPRVKELFELASDTLGKDMKALVFDAPEEVLKRTDNTQPAITLVNTSIKEYLNENGLTSQSCAGFSLGEYSALEDAGILSLEDMFSLIKFRGEFMHAAGEKIGSGETGDAPGMAAVIGLSAEKIEELFGDGALGVYPANYNAPNQIVIAGTAKGLAQAEEICKAQGARRFMPLKVSAPFHSPFMAEAGEAFGEILKDYRFRDPVKTFYSNVSGKSLSTGEEAKAMALAQITSPVRWVDEEKSIIAASSRNGAVTLLECGPGKVLCGLWKSMESALPCQPCGTLEQLRAVLDAGEN